MLKKMKIRTKLLVAFAVVLLLTVIIAFYSVMQLQKATDNLKDFMEGAVAAVIGWKKEAVAKRL